MSRIRSKNTKLEEKLEEIISQLDVEYVKYYDIIGKPDFAFPNLKIAIFADSDFWHGYNWDEKKHAIKTNKEFWHKKIERNIQRDIEVTKELKKQGWTVIRFWGHEIRRQSDKCKSIILEIMKGFAPFQQYSP